MTLMKKTKNPKTSKKQGDLTPEVENPPKPKDVLDELLGVDGSEDDALYDAYQAEQKEDADTADKALAAVPIEAVAMVAATLSRPDMTAHDCVVKAYEILEIATFGQNYLARKLNHPYIASTDIIQTLQFNTTPAPLTEKEEKDLEKQYKAHQVDMRLDDLFENPKPFYPFEETLKEIIPRPGKNTERLPLFRRWLMAKYRIPTIEEAGDKIAEWRQSGIPLDVFRTALDSYPKWRPYATSESAKERQKLGQIARNAKKEAEQKRLTS